MNIHAFICTRSINNSPTTDSLLGYLDRAGVITHLLVDKANIFSAYHDELATISNPNDIIILCHDDIEILSDPKTFIEVIKETLSDPKIGFGGLAGTKKLTKSGIWWDGVTDPEMRGFFKGTVFHGKTRWDMQASYYGVPGEVAVVDGLLMVAKVSLLRKIGLEKPNVFPAGWHYYDMFYCMKAFQEGYTNKVMPILVRHESIGEVDLGWHQNREKFLLMYNNMLPISCK